MLASPSILAASLCRNRDRRGQELVLGVVGGLGALEALDERVQLALPLGDLLELLRVADGSRDHAEHCGFTTHAGSPEQPSRHPQRREITTTRTRLPRGLTHPPDTPQVC